MTESEAAAIVANSANGINVTSPGGTGYSAFVMNADLTATSTGLEIANAFSTIWSSELGPTVDVVIQS